MKIHILGICGTFMGGLALLARELGHQVSGQDAQVYPPMSTQLATAGIALIEGYDPADIPADVDQVVVGNALSRGNLAVEWLLNRRLPLISGPQWLYEQILSQRWVIAIAGTHGKTSTSAMVATILEQQGFNPGFLIGGVPLNFGISARLGSDPYFVVEADEYDCAFFDKRSKFLHYHPQTVVLNNLEFDHADIFADLAAIQTQFHHLVRTIPSRGQIILPADDGALQQVLERGVWSRVVRLHEPMGWQVATEIVAGQQQLTVIHKEVVLGRIGWSQSGHHSARNGLAAIVAAHHAGIKSRDAVTALAAFRGVKRRLEPLAEINGVTIYDDFAHHPTAIATTLAGVRALYPTDQIIAVVEPRSNTMRLGVHAAQLPAALAVADRALLYLGGVAWQPPAELTDCFTDLEALVAAVVASAHAPSRVVVMSNGGFGGFHQRLIAAFQSAV